MIIGIRAHVVLTRIRQSRRHSTTSRASRRVSARARDGGDDDARDRGARGAGDDAATRARGRMRGAEDADEDAGRARGREVVMGAV